LEFYRGGGERRPFVLSVGRLLVVFSIFLNFYLLVPQLTGCTNAADFNVKRKEEKRRKEEKEEWQKKQKKKIGSTVGDLDRLRR